MPNNSSTYNPGAGGFGIVIENMIEGDRDGKNQIDPKAAPDEIKYQNIEKIPEEKALDSMFVKGG